MQQILADTKNTQLVDRYVDEIIEAYYRLGYSRQELLGERYDLGIAWVNFPVGLGGLDLDRRLQRRVEQRLAEAGLPGPSEDSPQAYGMAGPTILKHGSAEQHARYLRPMFTGAESYCQLFSEPGAGSDLASVSTRAVFDGHNWIINGQKVWTSLAHNADIGLLLARSDPSRPKRQGLTYFLLDMSAPGVETRPLMQLTGSAEFNEVFLTDVAVSDECRLGSINDGWTVARTTLSGERSVLGGGLASTGGVEIADKALETWRDSYGPPGAGRSLSPREYALRDRLLHTWVKGQVLSIFQRYSDALDGRGELRDDGPLSKLLSTEITQTASNLMLEILGAEGMLYPSGYRFDRPEHTNRFDDAQQYFLRCRSHSIGGGTSEIVRNIIGERLLGLPLEPNLGQDRPSAAHTRTVEDHTG